MAPKFSIQYQVGKILYSNLADAREVSKFCGLPIQEITTITKIREVK